ncbi:MAG: archaeosortase/exosortase family protein [Candidatus Krumholzibacteria bacterium]|nr:archaeosortase/exosortase family protein [Candidatus Krumholzibacteria bacterium]
MGLGKKPEGQKREARRTSESFRREFFLFLILFFVLWLFSYLLTRLHPGIAAGMQLLVAREVAWCLDLLGYRFELASSTFTFFTDHGGERLVVIAECTGLYTTIIYCSIIGAFPARALDKIAGLLIGVPAIHLLNLVRMVVVSLVLYHRREWFDFFHGYLWQVAFVIFMLMLVVVWMSKIAGRKAGRGGEGG